MKQTAVEFLVNETPNIYWEDAYWADLFERAKEFEKEQQDKFAVDFTEWLNEIKISDNQVYYNNTLGELLVNFKNK